MNPIVVVHGGGAGPISKDRRDRVHRGVVRAATVGYCILREGGSAVDAVEGAVVALEDDPEFNAGPSFEMGHSGLPSLILTILHLHELRSTD
ncbi:Isoaspartyl peptidase/L-asparaginase [Saguinus oedipus]|uniref:Isoaspartyl peptidase/L-asparaginase n=1 Tax=Saguinus oedipus TaxID=9490 RepID=A0ABQ9UTD9_SAGOE|nr:Isoaspartyl peptidase/L-asparaginase [Saguinus oedipus]